jgi:hypothetical protein
MEKERSMTTTTSPDSLRRHLRMLLGSGNAHMGFEQAVADFPVDGMNRPVPNATYTPWHILEHLRLVQLDMLNYMEDPNYTAPSWPDEFWPAPEATADEEAWNATIDGFRADLARFLAIVDDESSDLGTPIPTNPEHDWLRSIFIIAAHNHYHVGEFAALRQVMNTWDPAHQP